MPHCKSCRLLQGEGSFHTLFSTDPRDGVGLAWGFTASFKPLFFLSLQNKAHAPAAGTGCLYPSESPLTPPIGYPHSLEARDLVKLPFHATPSLTLLSPPTISTISPFRLPLQAQPRASMNLYGLFFPSSFCLLFNLRQPPGSSASLSLSSSLRRSQRSHSSVLQLLLSGKTFPQVPGLHPMHCS